MRRRCDRCHQPCEDMPMVRTERWTVHLLCGWRIIQIGLPSSVERLAPELTR